MNLNLASSVVESARRFPDKPAVILDEHRLTYRQLDEISNRFARGLLAAGIGPGDKVGLQLPNVPQFPIAYLGILKAGAVAVPMNPLLKAPEIEYHLEDSEAKAFIAWTDFAADAIKGAERLLPDRIYISGRDPQETPPAGAHSFSELLMASADPLLHPTRPEDTCVIIYTSGTTGRPKGAEITHFNFVMNVVAVGLVINYEPTDVSIAVLPLFHSFGLSSVLNGALFNGTTVTLVPRFDPGRVLETIQRDRVTIFCGVPTMYFGLLRHPDAAEFDTSSLRICASGGAAMPLEVMREFEQKFRAPILEGYGLSETSPTATWNPDPDDRKPLSAGKPIWGVEIQIFDDRDQPLPPGADHLGEIVIRGHNVMKGYYRQPEATAEAMRGGWFHTGDIGYLDEEGFLFIVDRKKEMIIRGGLNVYPREVEEAMYGHPAIAEAAVIGVPDQRLGEEVVAFVSLKPGTSTTEQELIDFCKDRMAAYKYPRRIYFEPGLPKGATGKILKLELKKKLGV